MFKDLSNENIIHKRYKDIEYLQFRRLLEYQNLVQLYTLKAGNLGFKITKENKNEIQDNYKKICEATNIDINKIVRPKQAHTANVEIINKTQGRGKDSVELKNIDGLITNKKNLALSLTYADCIPLLFYDPKKNVIANIHSGWKGTVQKIGKNTVEKMQEKFNCNPKDIICCIGPSIGKCCFEVDEDVKEIFKKTFPEFENLHNKIIEKGKIVNGKQKYNIDTVRINRLMLEELGLQSNNIIESKICTVCNSDQMHSYRIEKQNYSTNTAIIAILPFCTRPKKEERNDNT